MKVNTVYECKPLSTGLFGNYGDGLYSVNEKKQKELNNWMIEAERMISVSPPSDIVDVVRRFSFVKGTNCTTDEQSL